MGVSTLNPIEYGRLCGEIVPKAIETDEEFDRLVAEMEAIDFKENPTPEEEAYPPHWRCSSKTTTTNITLSRRPRRIK